MLKYHIGRSNSKNPEEAVREAAGDLKSAKLILFFSGVPLFEEYAKAVKDRFPDAISLGATTYTGLIKEGEFKDSLVMVIIEDGIECSGGVLEDIDKYPIKYIDRLQKSVNDIGNTENTICFELCTALLCSEESVVSTLNSVLLDRKIPVVGGSAGDVGTSVETKVAYNGEVCERSCVFVLIKNLGGKIHLYREKIYEKTGHRFTATKVDIKTRTVYEYNHKPAAKVIADALNVSLSELPKYLDSNPMGRMIGEHTYIVANCKIGENNSMVYHSRIYDNSKMVLLKPAVDYKNVIESTCNQMKRDVERPSFAIVINCLARSILFDKEGYLNDFAVKMGRTLGNYIGFSGYGEQLREQHFNQTMVVAVFE